VLLLRVPILFLLMRFLFVLVPVLVYAPGLVVVHVLVYFLSLF